MELTSSTQEMSRQKGESLREGERLYNHRVTDQLLYYWLMKKGGRRYPSEHEINPDELKEIWKYCFLIQRLDVEKGGVYNYTYLGDALKETYKLGIIEEDVLPIVSPKASLLHRKFQDVLATGKPLIESGEGFSFNDALLYRQCFLPLGPENTPPDFVLGCMNYKLVKP